MCTGQLYSINFHTRSIQPLMGILSMQVLSRQCAVVMECSFCCCWMLCPWSLLQWCRLASSLKLFFGNYVVQWCTGINSDVFCLCYSTQFSSIQISWEVVYPSTTVYWAQHSAATEGALTCMLSMPMRGWMDLVWKLMLYNCPVHTYTCFISYFWHKD